MSSLSETSLNLPKLCLEQKCTLKNSQIFLLRLEQCWILSWMKMYLCMSHFCAFQYLGGAKFKSCSQLKWAISNWAHVGTLEFCYWAHVGASECNGTMKVEIHSRKQNSYRKHTVIPSEVFTWNSFVLITIFLGSFSFLL